MRRLALILILLCVCAVSSIAQTTFNAVFHCTNFVSQPSAINKVTLTPLAPFVDFTNATLDDSPIVSQTDSNGIVTFSNLFSGYSYIFELDASYKTVLRTNGFPSGLTGTVSAEPYFGVWLPGMAIFAYISTNQIPVLTAGTGVIISTNGNNYTIIVSTNYVATNDSRALSWTNVANVFTGKLTLVGATTFITNAANPIATLDFPQGVFNSQCRITLGDFNPLYFSSDRASASIYYNPNHSGGGEVQMLAPRFSILPAYGAGFTGAVQFGAATFGPVQGSLGLFYYNCSTYPTVSFQQGYSYANLISYDWWNGSGISFGNVSYRAEAANTLGDGYLRFAYGTFVGATTGNSSPTMSESLGISTLALRVGTNADSPGILHWGAFIENYTNVSLAGTNYGVDPDGPSAVNLTVNGNVNLTNVPISFARTNQRSITKVIIIPGTGTYALTTPANWLWKSSMTNAAAAPTNIPAATKMEISLENQIDATSTNLYASASYYAYAPTFDTNALALFAAIVNSGGTVLTAESNAFNQFLVNLKAVNLWTNWAAIYPELGRSSNGCSWNAVATNKYRIAWTVGAGTFDGAGFTSDGSASFGDTGYNPTTAGDTYVATNGTLLIYCGTAAPTGTTPAYFIGATSASGRAAIVEHSSSFFGGDGFNGTGGEFILSSNPSPFNGTTAYTIFAGGFGFYTPTGQATGTAGATSVPNANFYIGAKNAAGTAGNFIGAKFGLVMIGGGISQTQYATLQTIVGQYASALGR